MMIDQSVQLQIQTAITNLSERQKIRILHACESGSRAWGFASPDSDYDVRIIYCRSADEYLKVCDHADHLEDVVSDDLDIAGWDIKKALQLMGKSNAVVFEWLQSPIVYRSEDSVRDRLWKLAPYFFQPRTSVFHYLGTVRKSLSTIDQSQIKIKKCFYVLRPLLAALWIVVRDRIPPMEFAKLRELLTDHPSIDSIVSDLLEQKAIRNEKHLITMPSALQSFIDSTVNKCEQHAAALARRQIDFNMLDTAFREIIRSK
jgi:uncharacterized protein